MRAAACLTRPTRRRQSGRKKALGALDWVKLNFCSLLFCSNSCLPPRLSRNRNPQRRKYVWSTAPSAARKIRSGSLRKRVCLTRSTSSSFTSLFDLHQLAVNLRVRRSLLVVDLDKFPAHDSFRVNHERRRMRPTAAVRVEDAVAVDHFVIFVFKQWKVELAVEPFAQHIAEFLRLVVIVGADGEDLHFFFLLF